MNRNWADFALRHTQFAEATCGTIRLKLFKIGALVRVSVRRIKVAMASAYPYQNEFALAHLRLTTNGTLTRKRGCKISLNPRSRHCAYCCTRGLARLDRVGVCHH